MVIPLVALSWHTVQMNRVLIFLRQVGATVLLALNSVIHIAPLLVIALIKLLTPIRSVRQTCHRLLMGLATSWVGVNSWMMHHLTITQVTLEGEGLLEDPALMNGCFLLMVNHQSWVDIPVLQKVFNRRLPMLRFFLKKELIWVPILGLAWWALEFPFMKRYSQAQIAKNPKLAGQDLETTKKACEKFKAIPVTIVNFVEGTRFSEQKRQQQGSPFTHLLKPKAGGIAFVLEAMGEQIDRLINVTITYPEGGGELMDLFANRIPHVRVRLEWLLVPEALKSGDYQNDPRYRQAFQSWLNALWQEKDQAMADQTMG